MGTYVESLTKHCRKHFHKQEMLFLRPVGWEPVILTSSIHTKLLKIYIPFVALKLYRALGKELSKMKLA